MSVYGSSGAAGAMGIIPSPIGTLDELRKQGINPALVGSCARPSAGVRGCQHHENCIFRFRRFGGFRDDPGGARNIGYFLQTHEGNKKEAVASCHFFMQRLYDRMRAGERDRQDGKNGEIIQVIAQEGEIIHRQMTVNVNEGKLPVQPAKYEKKTFTGPVPAFPRPGQRPAVHYDTLLDDRRRAREAQETDLQVGQINRIAPDEVVQPVVFDDVASAEPESGVPVAVPMERKGK